MARVKWTYMLRLLKRNPDRIRMDRLAEYMREFAKLLGLENEPIFGGVRKASTGIKAVVPAAREKYAYIRLVQAKTEPESKPATVLRSIETMMGEDKIKNAQLLDANKKVVYLFQSPALTRDSEVRIQQSGMIDGVVTGLVGADDTMHLYLRDHFERDLKLIVRSEEMARLLLSHFRLGTVRAYVHGTWVRTENGWVPEASKCTVDRFEPLEDTPLRTVFEEVAAIPGNEWKTAENAQLVWRDLRGIH